MGQTKTPAAPAPQSPYQGSVVEEIVARVNDQIISRSDFARAEQELDAQARQQGWSQQQTFEQKHDLLRDLIDQQLLLSRGKELGISGETEVVKRLDEIRKQNHLDSMEDLQKAVEAQSLSFEDFKQHIRDGIVSSTVIRNEVGQHLSLSQAEVQQYYDAHKADFDTPEQVRLSEILIPTANPDDASQIAAAQAKADDVIAKLKAGDDFAALAKTASGGPTAPQGGELGEFKRGQLAKILEDQTFDLKPGQYTQPIRTKQGFVILKVNDHTPGGVQPLKSVEPQVEDAVYSQKMGPKLRDYLTQLRVNAYIDIKPGYEDSGASPNETKPVYSAYTPPTGKKKHVDRTRFRQKATRQKPATETASAPAPPSNVPSLAQVPQGGEAAAQTEAATAPNAPAAPAAAPTPAPASQVASSGTEKPGKKEKIRFGQAPRETLPAAPTKNQDAGAGTEGAEVASGNVPQNVQVLNPDGTSTSDQAEEKKEKTRFSARVKEPKQKKSKDQTDPFAPPAADKDELATQQTQSTPLGLNGDTAKPKKAPKPTEKTRYSDKAKEKPETDQQQQPATQAPADQQPQAPAPASGTQTPQQQ
jgi:peptidyl-prolyl cis-trans isomerase SurA